MKLMLIIMSMANHRHMGKFIWKFHLPAEISPCSIHYQEDVEKRRREKITQTYFHPGYWEKGMREKEQLSGYQKDGSANQGFSYGYSFRRLFMEKKRISLVNKLFAAVYMWDKEANYMNMHKTCRIFSARPHSQKM